MAPLTRSSLCRVCCAKLDRYDDRIKCSGCSESMHIKCVNISVQQYQLMNGDSLLETWKCSGCLTEIADDSAAVATEGDINDTTGNDGDLLNKLLAKIDILSDRLDAPCRCSGRMQDLIDENRKLINLVNSQATQITAMRVEFASLITNLEKKVTAGKENNSLSRQAGGQPEIARGTLVDDHSHPEMAASKQSYADNAELQQGVHLLGVSQVTSPMRKNIKVPPQ